MSFAPPMSEPGAVPPSSYNPRSSVASRPVSELPPYTLEADQVVEEEEVPPAFTPRSVSTDPAPSPSIPLTPEPKNFSYELKNLRSKPWVTLTLCADPRLNRTTPTFTDGSSITGSINLSLQKEDGIKSIVVFVRGDLVTEGDPDERRGFLRIEKVVWTAAMGDPRAPNENVNWGEKLRGEYHWPLSMKFPERLAVAESGAGEGFRLPHSFTERFSRASIEYYLELRITRGRFRADDRLITQFGYFSMQQPARPSLLRQLAYESSVPILGPQSDAEGWHALEPVRLRGTIFGERAVDAKCTVFLAKPLCYTRGTAIPCAMTIQTDDTQAADILASIKSSALYLQRSVNCSFGASWSKFKPCGQATWWPSPEAASPENSTERHLMGEIHLRKDLQPSTAIKDFRIEYAVVVFPFAAVAFKPASSGPLCTQRVEIVTRFGPGPRPTLATPPSYESNDALVDRHYESLLEASRVGLGIKLWSPGG
ncbi:hypothetical protein DFH09DRAFT_55718 [Mycena vulgaris]|nr:hypothetical protein DFH09DRAFT_55718 [Mycena vulgaris]